MTSLQNSLFDSAGDRVALTTGGSGGIGLPIAIRLTTLGLLVVIADVDAAAVG